MIDENNDGLSLRRFRFFYGVECDVEGGVVVFKEDVF